MSEELKDSDFTEDLILLLNKHLPKEIARHYARLLRKMDKRILDHLIESAKDELGNDNQAKL